MVHVREVRPVQSRSGNTRYVLTDDGGERYSTFREEIGERAMRYIGRPAKISFHRTRRGNFENVYLDSIDEPSDVGRAEAPREAGARDDAVGDAAGAAGPTRPCADDVEEVAWKTAVDAAPWLLGAEPKSAVSPEELFEKLKPLKDLVAEDLTRSRSTSSSTTASEVAEDDGEEEEGGRDASREEGPGEDLDESGDGRPVDATTRASGSRARRRGRAAAR